MKRETIWCALTAGALGFLVSFGGAGCLVSAFDLKIENIPELTLALAGISLLSGVLFLWKHGALAATGLLALGAGYLWRDGQVQEQFFALLQQISAIYDRAYGWGVLRLVPEVSAETAVTLPVCIYGVLAALSVVWAVCRRKQLWGALMMVLLPLSACIVVTDTVPEEWYLLILMVGLVLLILTNSVRRENALQGVRLTAAAALPVTVALLALFLAIPQDSYVNHAETLRAEILTAVQRVPASVESELTQLAADLPKQASEQVDLSTLGRRIPRSYPVMEVTADRSGTLYLRGQDFDSYDGQRWATTGDRSEVFHTPGGEVWNVKIQTHSPQEVMYFPGYPHPAVTLTGGFLKNSNGQTDYNLSCVSLPADWRYTACRSDSGEIATAPGYLSLPDATRQQATDLIQGLVSSDASNTEKADAIAALVTNCAVYDLNADSMPETHGDFALWFLTEAERGYCVHFATAATVLLRAAEVPARYVTGYMVDVRSGQTVTVTEESAHAWAEYFEPNLGCWISLEATPASPEPPESTTAPAPTQTEPEPTTPETEPETPEESSAPHPTALPEEAPTEPLPEQPTAIHPALWIAGGVGLLIPVLAAQRWLRIRLRRRRFSRGSSNRQALARWREAERLSLLLKETPPEELIALAQKAKFSQYDITGEELHAFDNHIRFCCRRLKKKPLHLRLIHQYIHAAF